MAAKPIARPSCNVMLRAGCDRVEAITIRSNKYMNNAIEQDHRRVKRRIRSMLGFKSEAAASITLADIELVHMMCKHQSISASTKALPLKQHFTALEE